MFDTFLSYSRQDEAVVVRLAEGLRAVGIEPFLDRWHLAPGQPWPELLEKRLSDCRSTVIFVGPTGLGRWQQREQYRALDRQANDPTFAVIPVLLPGVDDPALGFLGLNTWIDLRGVFDETRAVAGLANAIRGQPLGFQVDPRAEICPYRGLQPFREEDAAFFFGRDAFAERLVQATRRSSFFAVVGASGSGKSSVVRAGLVPRLRQGADGRVWDVLTLVPGNRPLAALFGVFNPPPADLGIIERDAWLDEKTALLRREGFDLGRIVDAHLAAQPGTDRLLIVVDQWEELYTLARPRVLATDDDRRRATDVELFIRLLLHATDDERRLTVALTLRGDFYGQAVADRGLADRLDGSVVNIGPPLAEPAPGSEASELEAIIRRPAEVVGLTFEAGLVERILGAVGIGLGNLPLLEFLLTELWKRRERGQLTHVAYDEVGGIEGAIATRARLVFDDLKTPEQKAAARRLFLNLVTPGEGREDTRARARLPDDPIVQDVVDRFAGPQARLIVTNDDPVLGRTVEVSHEALIRHWKELRDWINANRETLRTRERIRLRLAEWQENDRDEALLLPPGRPLEEGRALLRNAGDVPIDDIKPYVEASLDSDAAHRQQADAAVEAERRRELDRQAELSLKDRRLRNVFAGAFVVVLVLAGAAARFAWQAQVALAGEVEESQRALIQESRALAALANQATISGDAVTGMLLALRALPPSFESPSAMRPLGGEALHALVQALSNRHEVRVFDGGAGPMIGLSISDDGARVLTVSAGGTMTVWETNTGKELMRQDLWMGGTFGDRGFRAELSPSGNYVIAINPKGGAWVGPVGNAAGQRILDSEGALARSVDFSPDGERVLVLMDNGTAILWSVDGARITRIGGPERPVRAAEFGQGGQTVVTVSGFGSVDIWNLAEMSVSQMELSAESASYNSLASATQSIDGSKVVAESLHGTVLWDIAHPEPVDTLSGDWQFDFVPKAAFHPTGEVVAATSMDGAAWVWNTENGGLDRILYGHDSRFVTDVAFSPDGSWVVTTGETTARLWKHYPRNELPRVLRGHVGEVASAAFDVTGRQLVTVSADGTARLWRTESESLDMAALRAGETADSSLPNERLVRPAAELVRHACNVLPRDLTDAQMALYGIDPAADWPCREKAATLWPHVTSDASGR